MRREDAERLAEPYSSEVLRAPARLASALGVPLPNVCKLAAEVFGDLDDQRFGIGWWEPHPGTARRILISDHLITCLGALETNLVEARLHLLEAQDLGNQEKRRFVDVVRVDAMGRHAVQLPPVNSPADEIVTAALNMHIVGCVRALASTLDCFASVIVGILALPTPIVRSGYKELRKALEACTSEAGALPVQADSASRILDTIRSAGPTGWDDWVLGYRNMLVHRGRRLHLVKLAPTGAQLHGPRGSMFVPVEPVPVLPNDPGRTDVEVLRDASAQHFLLTESCWETLEAATRSVWSVIENGSAALHACWVARRSSPESPSQPRQQWPTTEGRTPVFEGYAPGTVPFDATEFRTHPDFGRRMKAAALEDSTRGSWTSFD